MGLGSAGYRLNPVTIHIAQSAAGTHRRRLPVTVGNTGAVAITR